MQISIGTKNHFIISIVDFKTGSKTMFKFVQPF